MLKIIPIPAFSDNYIWLFHASDSREAFVVDPGDARPVEATLENLGLSLAGILITHHHADHTGGIADLLQNRDVPVWGPRSPRIPQVTHPVGDGDRVETAAASFLVMTVPGHTLDHIAYFNQLGEAEATPVLFCGDTLFAGGCGRMFEGDPVTMQASLARLATLPASTRVYCAHEYTVSNMRFASAVLEDDSAVSQRLATEQEKRSRQEYTVPSTLGLELKTNVFLRCDDDDVRQAASRHAATTLGTPAEVFGALRRWKDQF